MLRLSPASRGFPSHLPPLQPRSQRQRKPTFRTLSAGAEIAIPLLTKASIDGPIASSASSPGHGYGLLVPIGLAAIGLGILEVALNLLRRRAQATAVAGLEQSMRDMIYQHLQRLEPAFHDQWQSGQ